jgi:hypothetical protein
LGNGTALAARTPSKLSGKRQSLPHLVRRRHREPARAKEGQRPSLATTTLMTTTPMKKRQMRKKRQRKKKYK